jgi:hypothetical protein
MVQIKDFPKYYIDKDANVYSSLTNKVLKPGLDTKGYKQVNLSKNGKVYTCRVHRLVAKTFIPNTDNKPCINHINGIRTDNRIDNLEWCTKSENAIHAYNTGLFVVTENMRNVGRTAGKINCKKAQESNKKPVLHTEYGIFYESAKEAAEILGIKYASIKYYLSNLSKNNKSLVYA